MSLKTRNQLLLSLPVQVAQAILDIAEFVHIDVRDPIIESNKPIENVYFIETGVISIVAHTDEGNQIELYTVGMQGMVGDVISHGVDQIEESAFCQIEATGWKISKRDFIHLLQTKPELKDLCERYSVMVFHQLASNTACNMTHTIDKRCARWLLLTQDRIGGNKFMLTQEFLAMMLGVSRTSVNQIAGQLADAQLISYVRGKITILDREGLEKASCKCYLSMRGQLPPPMKPISQDSQAVS